MEVYGQVWSYGGAVSLVLASFLLILLVHPRWESTGLCVAFLAVVGALHAVSLTNAFFGPLPGAEWDARSFHHQAAQLADIDTWPVLSIGTKLYEYILTAAYRLFGSHILVGQSLSVLVTTVTLMTMSAVAANLGVTDSRTRAGMILVAGLFPTFLYHNALTFREPYELLGLMLAVLCVLKALEEHRPAWISGAVLGLLFMGLFHHILLGISVLLICIFILFLYVPGLNSKRHLVVMITAIVMIGGTGYVVITNAPITMENDYIKKIRQEQSIVDAIVKYRSQIESRQPRTSFNLDVDTSSGSGVAKGAVHNYWNYLGRPYVSDLESAADLVPFASTAARILLLVFLLWHVVSNRRVVNAKTAFCIITYFVITMVWSLGTTNYGQAFRHHALTDWLLVLLTGYVLVHRERRRPAVS